MTPEEFYRFTELYGGREEDEFDTEHNDLSDEDAEWLSDHGISLD